MYVRYLKIVNFTRIGCAYYLNILNCMGIKNLTGANSIHIIRNTTVTLINCSRSLLMIYRNERRYDTIRQCYVVDRIDYPLHDKLCAKDLMFFRIEIDAASAVFRVKRN